jgi:hypothetical protein
MVVEAGGLLFAVFLGAGAGPVAGLFVTAAVTPLTRRMAEKIAAEWSRKSNVIAESALPACGLGNLEDFGDALTGDPDMIALTQKIFLAASATGNNRKLRTFGALLGGAIKREGHQLNEVNLLIDALEDLEDPHVAVMDVIAAPPPDERPGWLPTQVQAEVGIEPDLVLACLNMLIRHGLADTDNDTMGGIPQFKLTKLGRALADVIKRAASDPGGVGAE